MKRFFAVSVLLSALSVPIWASDVSLGLRFSLTDYSETGEDWRTVSVPGGWSNGFSVSLAAGAGLDFRFTDWFGLQLEMMLGNKGLKYTSGDYHVTETRTAFSVPLLLRFNADLGGAGLYFLAGSQIDLLFDDVNLKDSTGAQGQFSISSSADLSPYLVNLVAGSGVMIPTYLGFVDIGIRYTHTLNRYDGGWDGYYYGIALDLGVWLTFGGNTSYAARRDPGGHGTPPETADSGSTTVELTGLSRPSAELFKIARSWTEGNRMWDDHTLIEVDWDKEAGEGVLSGKFTGDILTLSSTWRAYSAGFVIAIAPGTVSLRLTDAVPVDHGSYRGFKPGSASHQQRVHDDIQRILEDFRSEFTER